MKLFVPFSLAALAVGHQLTVDGNQSAGLDRQSRSTRLQEQQELKRQRREEKRLARESRKAEKRARKLRAREAREKRRAERRRHRGNQLLELRSTLVSVDLFSTISKCYLDISGVQKVQVFNFSTTEIFFML